MLLEKLIYSILSNKDADIALTVVVLLITALCHVISRGIV